jgi:radical SAM superfamily enzyme YgiQ (UPF0313 family)
MKPDSIIMLNFLPVWGMSYLYRGSIYPSTASMLIGTFLKNCGYSVKIIDGAYDSDYLTQLADYIKENKVLYVGMTVMTTQIPYALEASAIIRKCNPDIPIIWGGPHPTLFSEMTLKHKDIDIAVINEGVFTSLELADFFRDGGDLSSIKGIGFKNAEGQLIFTSPRPLDNINDLPYFDFSLIDVEKYLNPTSESVYQREFPRYDKKIKALPILTALGCPYKCEFCINVILKRRYRFKSAESIVKEIKELMCKYDVNTFIFLDEDFFVNKNRVVEFISLAEKENLHFNWRMWCRVDHFKENYINKQLLERLEFIGYGSMVMGGESANQQVLDNIHKGITVEQITHSLKLLNQTSITPRYSFMVGLENETLEQIKNTYQFCIALSHRYPLVDIAGPFIFRLYPGSPIYQRVVEKYHLNIPNNLEEWAQYLKMEDSFTELPWTPVEFQKNIRLLQFYSQFAFENVHRKTPIISSILHGILRSLARFRISHFFLFFPFEFWGITIYMKVRSREHD